MKPRVLECPRCGGPLPRRAALVRLVCEYCKNDVVLDRFWVKAADYRARLVEYRGEGEGADCVEVSGTTLRVLGRLATGHSTDVLLARRATRLSEQVVIKRLREAADEALLHNEQRVLGTLEQSDARGASHFTTLLPQRVGFGRIESAAGKPLAAVFREATGFAHTLGQVANAHARALDARHLVWLGRRLLELLGFIHRSGFVHGALVPAHILVDAESHGARLVGFSCAAAAGTRVARSDAEHADFYPEEMLGRRGMQPRDDLAMLARCLLWATANDATKLPAPLAEFLAELGRTPSDDDAWQAEARLGLVAKQSFGAPRFVKLDMP
ncbi:MAG: hypothetical protein QM756_42860 [Polyangiaceae bacterium]